MEKEEGKEEIIIESKNNDISSTVVKEDTNSKKSKEGDTIEEGTIEIKEVKIPETMDDDNKIVNEIQKENIIESQKITEQKGQPCQKCGCTLF